ncbi:MAG: hypothetical protein CMK59_03255 [Proteobacteria bacterium]|nr:hypothetical protein [Pseudomonadota bacterium]
MSNIPSELIDPFFIENRLHDYLDGQLDEEETAFVEAGLKQFPELEDKLEELKFSRNLLRSQLNVDPPEDLLAQIEAAVHEEPSHEKRYQAPVLMLLAAAILLIFLIPDSKQDWSKDVASAQSIQANPMNLPLNNPASAPPKKASSVEIESPKKPSKPAKAKQKTRTKKTTRTAKLKASQTPVAEIYIPDDEKDAYAAADNYLSARQDLAEHSVIQTTNTRMLYDLHNAANQHGIKILTPNNSSLEAYDLSQDRPFQLLKIQFNSDQWSIVNEMVNNMGGNININPAQLKAGTNTIDLEISYWYTP